MLHSVANPYFGPVWLTNFLLNSGTAIFLIAALIEAIFLVHYVRVAPAFKSLIGWMFVLRSVSFLLAGLAILLGRLLGPDYFFRPYVTFVLYVAIFGSAVVTYFTFVHERRKEGRRGPRAKTPYSFARRAIGLSRFHPRRPENADEAKPTTRPLKIVKDAP